MDLPQQRTQFDRRRPIESRHVDRGLTDNDAERGEPRGARSKKADLAALRLGACVDCTLCVQVCPTGIDIRKGLQYECIGCGACADVCDTVMDKMGYARGLIRFTTQHALREHWSRRDIVRYAIATEQVQQKYLDGDEAPPMFVFNLFGVPRPISRTCTRSSVTVRSWPAGERL